MNESHEPGEIDDIDLTILTEVRSLWSDLDAVPTGLASRAKFALTMHALEAELAELIEPELALTRAGEDVARAESMTFTSSRCTLMITVDLVSASIARIDGWMTTPGALVTLHSVHGELTSSADDTGRLTFERVPRGPVRFVIWPGGNRDERPVLTPSTEV